MHVQNHACMSRHMHACAGWLAHAFMCMVMRACAGTCMHVKGGCTCMHVLAHACMNMHMHACALHAHACMCVQLVHVHAHACMSPPLFEMSLAVAFNWCFRHIWVSCPSFLVDPRGTRAVHSATNCMYTGNVVLWAIGRAGLNKKVH